MAGRIETYTHSDSVTQNKGGSLVQVDCQTDFAARTDGFIAFCKKVAKFAYAANSPKWARIIELFPDMETERVALEKSLKETVMPMKIGILKLDELTPMRSSYGRDDDTR